MVKMVIGQYTNKVADNGRTAIPKKFRDELGMHFIITQGYEGSLLIVPFDNWQKVIKETAEKPFFLSEARDTTRFLLGSAGVIDLDEQGRFIIPGHLRKFAHIGPEVIFLGLNQYIELWDLNSWEQYQEKLTGNSSEIAQKLSQIQTK